MKPILLSFILLTLFCFVAKAQTFSPLDQSPMDMAYFPPNFAHDRKEGQQAIIRVTYSRPAKNGRDIFGKLIVYGKVWRTGANEAPQIKFYGDVEMSGKKVKAGTYSLFTIPEEKQWTIILNSDLDYWGAYSYNVKNDILRVTVPVLPLNNMVEYFTIEFVDRGQKRGAMQLAWDKTLVEVPFTY